MARVKLAVRERRPPRVDAPGSVVRYLHDEEISEDATTDDLFAKVAALKKTRAAFTIGFVLPVGATLPVYDTPSVGGAGLFSCQGCMAAS